MKPSQLLNVAPTMFKIHQPFMVWGDPGAGKSQTIKRAAMDYVAAGPKVIKRAGTYQGDGFIDVRLGLMETVDMRGIPTIVNGKTVWMTPEMFPRDGRGVIFLDEIVQALPSIQAAASQLILDRRIADYKLPDGWAVCAAGNEESNRAATYKMPSHIKARFFHVKYKFDITDWQVWAAENEINYMIQAFSGFEPSLIQKFDPKVLISPTARAWEFLSNILNSGDVSVDENFKEIADGTIGEGAAVVFCGFCQVFREMPTYEMIVDDPEEVKIPHNPATKYAVAGMLATLAQKEDMTKITKYIERMPKEFQILCMDDMTRRNKPLASTASYINWAAKNSQLLINATVH